MKGSLICGAHIYYICICRQNVFGKKVLQTDGQSEQIAVSN